MTRRQAPARGRAPRDPYGIGPVSGYVGPAVAAIVLVVIALVTVSLFNGRIPLVRTSTTGGDGGDQGPTATLAPPDVVIPVPNTGFPGTMTYAKAGNIWVQTATDVRQVTKTGKDSMPAFSADGQWIYFIRTALTGARFPLGGNQNPGYYDLETPGLLRIHPDGTGVERLLTGSYSQGSYRWFYWLRQPVPSPDGKTIALISDGPNPLQSDITVHTFTIASKKLTSLNLPNSLHLGHQDPAWRSDGKFLLYVRNGRELTRGAPQIFRYEVATKKARALTGPGYVAPAYSRDGAWIAATQTDAFGTDVAILDASGKEVLRVTDDSHSVSPIWSPAGDAIAFLHLEGTIVDLRLARLNVSAGRWVVSETISLTKVSGLEGSSRPSWYVPASELPAASAPPASAGSVVPSSAP